MVVLDGTRGAVASNRSGIVAGPGPGAMRSAAVACLPGALDRAARGGSPPPGGRAVAEPGTRATLAEKIEQN